MAKINTMQEFKETLDALSIEQQRVVASRFIEDVLDLTDDASVKQAQKIAADPDAGPEALMSAYHAASHVAVESSGHSGLELVDWHRQTAHFVAKACAESLEPSHHGIAACHLAFNAASHCRMARLCANIDHEQAQPSLSIAQEALKNKSRINLIFSALLLKKNKRLRLH